jgi:hypothetical protein
MNFQITSIPNAPAPAPAPTPSTVPTTAPVQTPSASAAKSFTITSVPQPAADPNASTLFSPAPVIGGVLNAVTGSEQTLGKALSTIGSSAPGQANDINAKNQASKEQLLQAIHNQPDPAMKQHLLVAYQKIWGGVAPVTAGDINPAFNLTPHQVIGAAAGTALDAASVGSYGQAASGAKFLPEAGNAASILGDTGTLTKALPAAATVVGQGAKTALGDTLKSIGTKTAIRSATGAGVGYGYDVSQNLQNGKTGADAAMPGVGTAAGAIIPLGIGGIEAGAAITKDMAPRFINSLIKPKLADFSYGKDPGRTVATMGITGNSIDDFGNNISKAKGDVGTQLGAIYSNPANAHLQINGNDAIAKLDSAISDAASGGKNNQGIVTTLQNIKDGLLYDHTVNGDGTIVKTSAIPKDLSNLNPEQAQALKQQISAQTKFTGNPSDDKTVNSILKSMYGDLKGKLNNAVGVNNPEVTDLNQKYADLTSAEIATKNRTAIIGRQNMVNLPQAITGVGGFMSAIVTGNPAVALGTVGAVGLEKALASTAVKTRIASWLGSESPSVIQKVLEQNPEIKTVLYRALPKFAAQLGQPVTLPAQK